MSTPKSTTNSFLWSFGQQFSGQAISFVVSVILARLLLPAQFGLIGMMTLFMSLGNALLDSGFSTSLVRSSNIDQRDLSTVFYTNVIVGIIVYIIVFVCAPFVAIFYHQPILTNLLRVYALSFVITSFAGVQTAVLTRSMDFKKQTYFYLPSIIISGLIGILLAYKGYNVWALVYMNLVQSLIFVALHWYKSEWYPKLIFDMKRLGYHLNFGYKLLCSGILDVTFSNVFSILIGRLYDSAQLGFYTRANSLQMLPVNNISTALNKITLPLFASLQNDSAALKAMYKKVMLQVIFWVTLSMLLLFVMAFPIIDLLFTDKWLPAVPFLKILCVTGIFFPLHIYNLNILLVKGRSDLFLRIEIAKKIMIVGVIICVFSFGIYGFLYAQIIIGILAFFINTYYSGKLIGYNLVEQIKDISPILIIAILIAILGYFFDNLINDWNNISRICIDTFVISILYIGISYLFKLSVLADFNTLIKKKSINDSGN